MTRNPQIHGRRSSFSASVALAQLGDDLSEIKKQDGLTWKDVGRVLGKSEDRASNYATALAEMPVSSFLLGCREWNGRFANGVLSLIGMKLVEINADSTTDGEKLCHILKLAHLISAAMTDLETPGAIDDGELREIGADALDEATRAIDALRARLARLDGPKLAGVA
ncbi:hypothetical protein [Sphingobium sp. WCS2017Hpa-17]|uniref:hypothetical protein n=1 Tax=Sphingobium sp. WCS2017Hpa-17 TaxID=3073638 RepID=UPI00288A3032|nr:hypothetical protein [Sphingobium sp. WCS2017Hpa-17]